MSGDAESHKTPPDRTDRLHAGRVLLVGVGGLGCPAAWTLARAGVGTLGLIDGDRVEPSNLHRQVLHTAADVGRPKVASAADKLRAIAPALRLLTFHEQLTAANLNTLFPEFDFVIDATDTTASKYLINDGAVLSGTPFVHAGILGFRGQALTVIPHASTCVRCLFPTPPQDGEVPSCQEAGVLGVVGAALGTVQAGQAIAYLTGSGRLLTDRLLTFDALLGHWRAVALRRSPQCPVCSTHATISSLTTLAPAANAA